ncbi:LOW QUALITY PROTEIN: spermatogenesis-associated protein 17-like [Athalia rosae]|uniref:LOW QUALITY PROTEIN: spermatogenesis-associated protein 17-like n=1 Tax=Athalia rosae TaxID=37344 RepID=UPI0020337ACC|nr:LOW QUALITY PROTEIN: spermatogenesis-associated protein 17-like [Athalia rosae]
MASIEALLTDASELQREIKRRNDAAESDRARKFIAARKLQAWFRGLATRKHLRMLRNSAITIQRHWRGFMARKFAKSYVKDQVKRMWWNHYHRCATKIQALWRGYEARKNGVNIPKYKKWLHSVYEKNAEALTKMKEYNGLCNHHLNSRCQTDDDDVIAELFFFLQVQGVELFYARNITEHNSLLWILFILFKLHHLLRTESRPGVLTRIDETKFTVIEEMIRSLEYARYMENRRREKCGQQQPEISPPLLKGTYFARCEKEIRELRESLEMGKASLRRGEEIRFYV